MNDTSGFNGNTMLDGVGSIYCMKNKASGTQWPCCAQVQAWMRLQA